MWPLKMHERNSAAGQQLIMGWGGARTDTDKQAAINLFLGLYVPRAGAPSIWELPSDYFLHHDDVIAADAESDADTDTEGEAGEAGAGASRGHVGGRRRRYDRWWTYDPSKAPQLGTSCWCFDHDRTRGTRARERERERNG
jgi:hypothetical protein